MSGLKVFCLTLGLLLIGGCQSWQYKDVESLPPTAALPQSSQPGVVYAFYWENVSGGKVENLTTLNAYPDTPTEATELNALSGASGRGDNYGTLVRGYIEAPQSGDYRFYVSGDDETQFWLSPSESSAEANMLASVTGWTYQNQFDKYSSQVTPVQPLAVGQKYYFEIRHKEGTGGDHFAVAWEGPGFSRQVISGEYLHSWAPRSLSAAQEMPPETAYELGYRVGFFDGEQELAFNPDHPPLDEDIDGLYDNWEVFHGLNPADPDDVNSDQDGDLLSARDEFWLGAEPTNSDTDGDGIPDGYEYAYALDPLDSTDASIDLDGDGYSVLQEYLAGTDPADPDDSPVGELEYAAGFVGQYFTGMNFDQFVTARQDPVIDFNWGSGQPMTSIPQDGYSVRWSGEFTAPHDSGIRDYRFTTGTDDGNRLYLNDNRVIGDWSDHALESFSHVATLQPKETVTVTMEFYENRGGAVAQLVITDLSSNEIVSVENAVRVPSLNDNHSRDSDDDGIPDTWELKHGLNLWSNDASEISNNNGVSNLAAYESGLNPWTLEPLSDNAPSADAPETGVTGREPITLSWTAPLKRMDGTPIVLSEIDYYVINFGQDPQVLSETQRIDGAENSFAFDGLSSGTWYFTIRVVDNDGLSSPESEPVSAVAD